MKEENVIDFYLWYSKQTADVRVSFNYKSKVQIHRAQK